MSECKFLKRYAKRKINISKRKLFFRTPFDTTLGKKEKLKHS